MKLRSRIPALLLALVLLLSVPAAASEETSGGDVDIIYTNDIHTYIDNHEDNSDGSRTELLSYSNIAAMKEELQAEGENVLLVDAGDYAQGSVYGAIDEGESILQLMNAAGYDLSTLGNHEFDYGQERLFGIIGESAFDTVSCNFYNVADGTLVLPAYEIFDMDGVSVAFIGVTTPETYITASRQYFEDENGDQIYGIYGTDDAQDLYDSVQAAIDEIGDRADYIIALSHLGMIDAGKGWTSSDLIENTTGLDAVIDGHSHTRMEGETVTDMAGNEVLLTQTGCYLNAIGLMRIRDGEITTELITEYPDRDEDVQAMTDSLIEKVGDELGEQIAVADVDFAARGSSGAGTGGTQSQESNLGDIVADSVYYYFNEVQGLDCDVAIVNIGGLRDDMPAGAVSYEVCKTVQPFGNMECLIRISGSDLREMLEYSMKNAGGKGGFFGGQLQVAGVRLTVDSSVESTVQISDDGSWGGAPTGEYRVTDIEIYDRETGTYEPLDPGKEYTVAGSDYILRNNGNGYAMFGDSELVLDYVGQDYMAAAEYFKAFTAEEDGWPHLTSENSPLASYSGYLLDYEDPNGSGRIVVK